MRLLVFTVLFAGVLLAGFPALVQAELDCTDFLTFTDPGNTKLPADAFDYNTSIRVLRVSSGRVDGFLLNESSKGYFFVALAPYVPRNVTEGNVLYQYTPGVSEYYYRVLKDTTIPWSCGPDKMADLTVTHQVLSGKFYSASGELLFISRVPVVALDAGIEDGFLVPGFGTARKIYIAAPDNVTEISTGYLVYDAGNGTYVATSYKQARFHVPTTKTPFCNDWGFLCLDAAGTHVPACRGAGFHSYFCSGNVCVTNLTACPFGCEKAACLESKATASPTPTASGTVSTTPIAATPSSTVVASATSTVVAPSATAVPAASGSTGFETALFSIVVLALLAGAYYFFVAKRRPKGL